MICAVYDHFVHADDAERVYCVYMWCKTDESGYREPFYVGAGKKERPYDRKKRSPALLQYADSGKYEVVILADRLTMTFARELEVFVKDGFKQNGAKLLDGEDDYDYRRMRQAEGIAIAKAAGKYTGRKPIAIDKPKFEEMYAKVQRGECTNKYAQKVLGLKPSTYYKAVNDYNAHTGPWEVG